jgi:hypothetical protein
MESAVKASVWQGVIFGFSRFTQFGIYAVVFYAGVEFIIHY